MKGKATMPVDITLDDVALRLGDKDFLGFALQHCAAQFGGAECDFIPPIYSLPAQKTQWQRAHRAHAYWIRKDKAVWGSQGVSIVSSTKALPQESSFLLQLYVSRPLLWNGHKHDLRLWALITCAAPLRLYLLQDGWARMAARPWAGEAALGDAAKLKDDCMHLTATYCPDEPHTSLRIVRTNLARYRDGLGSGGAGLGGGGGGLGGGGLGGGGSIATCCCSLRSSRRRTSSVYVQVWSSMTASGSKLDAR